MGGAAVRKQKSMAVVLASTALLTPLNCFAKNPFTIPVDQIPQPGETTVFKAKTTALFSRPSGNSTAPATTAPTKSQEAAGDQGTQLTSPGPEAATGDNPDDANLSSPKTPNKLELGSVSRKVEGAKDAVDEWHRFYDAGLQDLDSRRYELAEDRLNASLKVARLGMGDDEKLMLSRIALAQVFMRQQKYSEAEKLFTSCQPIAKRLAGATSNELAACDEGLAELALLHNKMQKAELLVNEALAIRMKTNGESNMTAKCLILKAEVLSKNNWVEQAEATTNDGIKMLREHPTKNSLDLADALRKSALLYHEHGKTNESQALFERSYKLVDDAVRLNMPPQVEGQVNFAWEVGSPRSQEIPDSDFPLKYLQVDNVRVAATVIDLWELYGVIISVTNIGSERVNLGLGKPVLYGTSPDPSRPHLDKLEIIDPGSIDRIRRERIMWDLTMNRPWLANMQKTRSQRGFVPPSGHDLFRGPNVFGVYGEWAALPRDLPDKLMLEPSPERVQYQAETKIDPGLVRSSTIKIRNLVSISLEPFESRTGELFFLNPRLERLVLTVPIGNVVYQIPFSAKRKRIK